MVIQLRPRDRFLIKAVNDSQVLNINQIQTMFFKSYPRACYRVAQLVDAGFLKERYVSQIATAPAASLRMFTIGPAGVGVLADTFGYIHTDIYRGGRQLADIKTIKHLLAVNTVRAAIYRTCADSENCDLLEWNNERMFRSNPDYAVVSIAVEGEKKGKEEKKPVYPDGFFHLWFDHNRYYFIEADNGTEGLKQIKDQMAIYEAYYHTGAYEAKFQTPALRVLWITTTSKRMRGLQAAALEVGDGGLYLFSTFEHMQPQSVLFAPVWYETTSVEPRPLIK